MCTLCPPPVQLDHHDDMLDWLDEECGTVGLVGQLIQPESLVTAVFSSTQERRGGYNSRRKCFHHFIIIGSSFS